MRKIFLMLMLVPFLFSFTQGELDKPKAMCKECEKKIKAAKTKDELEKVSKACAEPLIEWAKNNPKVVKAKKEELDVMIKNVLEVYKAKKKQLKKKK
ncbi:MAG: hypothetical protein U0L22_04880 [Bacteroidales bacterium]|nr:hypothetical protein [Bacteroidales bacterium]